MTTSARFHVLRLAPVAMIAALGLYGCNPAPSEPSPLPPAPDTLMLVKKDSRFTYLQEYYTPSKPDSTMRKTITWLVSEAGPDSLPGDSAIWQATIIDNKGQQATIEHGQMKFIYRRNGDVIMRRYFNWNVSPGDIDMVIPLSTRADVELPYHHSIQEYRQGSHKYSYSSFTRTTVCRYLGHDTIEVAGERMACEHGQVEVQTYGASGERNYPIPSPDAAPYGAYAIEYWFAPKIGFIVKEKVYPPAVRKLAKDGPYILRTLQSYDLK